MAQIKPMWELIQENKRKSLIIFMAMGVCLILLGFFIGAAFSPEQGGGVGVLVALFIWLILSLISFYSGDSILLSLSNAREVSHDVHPQLFNIVEEMKIAANLKASPKIYIIDEPALNAFATGRSPEKSSITVTAGLLSKLNRDELQGVVAHEMSHIINRDVLFVTFAGVMLGSIVLISDVFLRGMRFSGSSSRRYRSSSSLKVGGQAQAIILIIAIIFAILAPILARIFYFAISRRREYLADASGVRLTRYPQGLASALERIADTNIPLSSANKITAPMYIINPLKARGSGVQSLFSTHPPTEERIMILRSMAQGVNYTNYLKAFSAVKGEAAIMPASALSDSLDIPIRKASVEESKEELRDKEKTRDIGDLMRAVNSYAFLTCVCGLKIKIPPNFKNEKLSCPRCGRGHDVPLSQVKAVAAALGAGIAKERAQPTQAQVYTRTGQGWESFNCSCGKLLQISPQFCATIVNCPTCGRKTEIK